MHIAMGMAIEALQTARPTVDKDYLIRLIQEAVYDGDACERLIDMVDSRKEKSDAQIVVNEQLREALEWTCKYASEYKVDIDICIEADGNITVGMTPTYRDRAEWNWEVRHE